ncbi:hypothetical protein OGATHE_006648 [Ogataea polymorpha]|uniref:Uncharacterized protein n=1 Tax=Ogataea polymorpha TaxID=460523 RepID=A0A9P8NSJ7_9ASCO|nr:hypothetical protein OGATHE_006648 [Ogataea polymorpha]
MESASELFLMASSHQVRTRLRSTTSAGPENESSAKAISAAASVELKTPSASLISDDVKTVLMVRFFSSSSRHTLSYTSG